METPLSTWLDAYALVALVGGELAGPVVEGILRAGGVSMATLNLAEALDQLERRARLPAEEIADRLEPLLAAAVDVAPLDARIAWDAASLRARWYHRVRAPVSLADCVLLSSASTGDAVATADRPVLRIAPELGLEPVELPRSFSSIAPW